MIYITGDCHGGKSHKIRENIYHISWWTEELPTDEEMAFGLENLKANGNKVVE